jgi:hypothetical protein
MLIVAAERLDSAGSYATFVMTALFSDARRRAWIAIPLDFA